MSLGRSGWQLAVKASKGDSTLGTSLSPAGHTLKECIAALMRVGNVETLAGQKHLHFHTFVQLHQLISRLHVLHGLSVGLDADTYLVRQCPSCQS